MVYSKKSIQTVLPKTGILLKNIDFCYNVRPIQFYSRIFGLIPFSIVRGANGEILEPRVKLFDFLWFIVAICFYLWLSVAHVRALETQQNPTHTILLLGDFILIASGIAFGAVVVVMDMFNRFRIVDILRKFTIFDKRVSKTVIHHTHLVSIALLGENFLLP